MKRIVPGLLLMVVAMMQPRQAAAQDPNDPLLNMQAIAQALGVQCSYATCGRPTTPRTSRPTRIRRRASRVR